MSIDELRPAVGTATSGWSSLERDWQSVLVGVTIVALVSLLELQIPW